jgi:hypothetical protein
LWSTLRLVGSEPPEDGLTVLLVGISEAAAGTYAALLTGMKTLRTLTASSTVARMSISPPFAVVVGSDLTGEERSKIRAVARSLTVHAISDFGGPAAVARHVVLLADRRRDRARAKT